MARDTRDERIDAYFDALDDDDLDAVRPALAESFVYESLSGTFEGAAGLGTYLDEVRSMSNSTHDVTRRIHGESGAVAEGVVTGTGADGETIEAAFCDVFEFDADDLLTRVAVYANDG